MTKLGNVNRRWVLSLLAALAAPMAARAGGRKERCERTVLVNGWILRAGDVGKAGLHAA
jgi:hypothetical protein